MEKSILKDVLTTIVFFDLFDFPLTAAEACQLISLSANKLEVDHCLEELNQQEIIEKVGEYWGLKGRVGEIGQIREKRRKTSEEKLTRIGKYLRWFQFFPYIRGVAVSNKLAYLNADGRDDVDLFILAEPLRLWTARFWVTAFFTILARRVHGKHFFGKNLLAYLRRLLNPCSQAIAETHTNEYEDTLCMPFWATPKIDLRLVRSTTLLTPPGQGEEKWVDGEDYYLDFWMKLLRVEYGHMAFEEFFEVNGEHWGERGNMVNKGGEKQGMLQRASEWFVGLIPEALYRFVQMKILPRTLKERMNLGTSVVIRDDVIKLHAKDRRVEYNQCIHERVGKLMKSIVDTQDLRRNANHEL